MREVAAAYGRGKLEEVGLAVAVLRRLCWFTGLLGRRARPSWAVVEHLDIWGQRQVIGGCGARDHAAAVGVGRRALIRGVRRIGDVAWIQVWSSLVGLVVSVGLCAWLGERGIVPVLLVSAVINVGFSWWFARRVPLLWLGPIGVGCLSGGARSCGWGWPLRSARCSWRP